MQANEYQRRSRMLALYPASATIYYPALGLAGELGEIANKVKKTVRGDYSLESALPAIRKELGDVMWYVAALATDCCMSLDELADSVLQNEPVPGVEYADLLSVVLALQIRAGKVAEMAEDYRAKGMDALNTHVMRAVLQEVLQLVSVLCVHFKADLFDICRANYDKLTRREEVGTLKGDGDNR